jgi:hypothetical protein
MSAQLLTESDHETRLQIFIETNSGLEAAHDIAHCSTRAVKQYGPISNQLQTAD